MDRFQHRRNLAHSGRRHVAEDVAVPMRDGVVEKVGRRQYRHSLVLLATRSTRNCLVHAFVSAGARSGFAKSSNEPSRIATAEVVHIDALLIRANVSWDSLVERHVGCTERERGREEMEVKEKGRQRQVQEGLHDRSSRDNSQATPAIDD